MPATEAVLRRELDDAFKNRAHLYRLLLEELTGEFGAAAAERVLSKVVTRRGQEIAGRLFAGCPAEPAVIAQRFLSVSPDGGDLYPHSREENPGSFTISVHRCPLKDAWLEAGLPAETVGTLCRIAGEFDRGLFEAAGVRFENSTWTQARGGGCCRITLTRA